jgi:hypothetical protein
MAKNVRGVLLKTPLQDRQWELFMFKNHVIVKFKKNVISFHHSDLPLDIRSDHIQEIN